MILGRGLMVWLLATGTAAGAGERLTFQPHDFRTWKYPHGLVTLQGDTVRVRRFARGFNAVADAGRFHGKTVGPHGTATFRTPSNSADASLIGDQSYRTWWQPSRGDPVDKWWIELDLGRTVVADKLRLVFPDTAGARPFTYFSVYISPGIRVAGQDRLSFQRINRPGVLNRRTRVQYALTSFDKGIAFGDFLVSPDTLHYRLVRFVRFEAQARPPGAALAEIEVHTVGFNVATRVTTSDRVEAGMETWGGDVRAPGSTASKAIDSDLANSAWNGMVAASGGKDWRRRGGWWVVDFGSTFRIDRMLWLPMVDHGPFQYGYVPRVSGCWALYNGIDFFASGGEQDPSADPNVEGPYRFTPLATVFSYSWPERSFYDFQFPARPIRAILLRLREGECSVKQLWVFQAEGFPSVVEFESPDMELDRVRNIKAVEWDATTPPGTRIEVETQTGNGYQTVTRYYLVNGVEVTRLAYQRAKARHRGEIVEDRVRDASWSSWSRPQRFSGQEFLSPTPRRWLRVRVRMISNDPEQFPALHSLSFPTTDPVIARGVTGSVVPREARLDSLQEFVYTVVPGGASAGDRGFDRVVITLPCGASAGQLVHVEIGDRVVQAGSRRRDSTLVIRLPRPVVDDTVRIAFRTYVFQDPTVFDAFVFHSEYPDDVQGVMPAWYGADRVFVPEISTAPALVRNLVQNAVFTPNCDGVNDVFRLRFSLVKTNTSPAVDVYSLSGRHVARLPPGAPDPGRMSYRWEGLDEGGRRVPPGMYVVRIRVHADAGDETVNRLVSVVY